MRKLTSTFVSALLTTTMLSGTQAAFAQGLDIQVSDEIIVRGVNIPDEKRATSEISSLLTPEKLERQGDSDIAAALRRVTGLSLSQGKFIVVRGLNERYSNLTLNGSPLPSPEPLRRVAPLDLFPTTVVQTALVQKTFSPEFSGEFGGGLIELRSKGVPDEGFLTVKIGGEIDTESTFGRGLTFDGGAWDWAGFGDSTYNVPPFLAGAITANPGVALRADTGVIEPFEAQAIGASLVNAEMRVIQDANTPANHDVNVSGGQRWDLDSGMSLGFVTSLGYSRDFQTKVGLQQTPSVDGNGEVRPQDDFNFESQTETVLTNALIAGGIEFDDNHELNITGIVLRKSTKEARLRDGTQGSSSLDGFDRLVRANTEFFENQVWSVQANSEHVFPSLSDLTVSFRGAYSEAYREAPYETEYVYGGVEGQSGFVNGTEVFLRSLIGEGSGASGDGFETAFSQVDDQGLSGGVDFELPLLLGDVDLNIKTGYAYNNTERDYVIRRFSFANATGLGAEDDFWYQRIDFLTSDPNIGSNGLVFVEFSDQLQPQAYHGELTTHGAYFGLDAQLAPYIRAAAGVRYEDGDQTVDNFNIAAIATPIVNDPTMPEASIKEDYFLPAVTLTWNPIEDIQVRAAFSQTITRPQFQELGDAFFTDTDRDLQVIGNPFLVNTETNNYDVRAEYYFGREQYITIGGFYKELTNPIEESLVNTGDDVNTTYINAPSAELYGFEAEYEQRFEGASFGEWGFLDTKDIVVSANYTWSKSSVNTDGDVIINVPNGGFQTGAADLFFQDGRALQGQSDHIVNAQIGYEDFESNSKLFLLFNWNSNRIRQVGLRQGGNDLPNTIERLPMTLDLVYSREFERWGGLWEISGKVGNILHDGYEATASGANGTVVNIDTYDVGTTFSLGLKRSF